jgi:ribosomal protein S6--L-glutamate ligase
MLETREGPKILEINSSPGLEGIERASGIDVAGAIITYAERCHVRRKHRRRTTLDDERRLSRIRTATESPRRRAGLNGGE